jgi:hypothetical protein
VTVEKVFSIVLRIDRPSRQRLGPKMPRGWNPTLSGLPAISPVRDQPAV